MKTQDDEKRVSQEELEIIRNYCDKKNKFFYTVKQEWSEVTKDEFYKYLENYPRELTSDCSAVSDPPLVTYNDFQLANRWPDSIVAKFNAGEGDAYYGNNYKNRYYVCINHEECFKSKTGRFAGDKQDLQEQKEKEEFWATHTIKVGKWKMVNPTTGRILMEGDQTGIEPLKL